VARGGCPGYAAGELHEFINTDRQTSMSDNERGSGNKTTIVLVSILGGGLLLLLACCGGVYWIGYKAVDTFQQMITMDRDQILTITGTMVDISVPDDLPPMMAMDMSKMGVPMKFVVFGPQDQSRSLLLMQMPGADPSGQTKMTREQFEQALNQQGQGGQMQQLNVSSSENWVIDFNGEECTFEMASGTDPARNVAARRLSGVFPAKGGPALFSLMTGENDWNEESVLQMIESMGGKLVRREEAGESTSETPPETNGEATAPADSAAPTEPATP
jgi:hypothetical protein